MIRRKVNKSKKTDQIKKIEKKIEREPQWKYLKNCTHNLVDKFCPLCKLIERETAEWLKIEQYNKNKIKKENFYLRAVMRYCLLREWSKNQIGVYCDVTLLPTAEIILSSAVVEALSNCQNLQQDLHDLEKNLEKRNHILEVGHYAAIYIQCRIRGYCCRKRVTHFMLRRFEYHDENTRKGTYFLDKQNGNRFYSVPMIIRQERPGTPRTIQRRIKSQVEAKELRLKKYREYCQRNGLTKEKEAEQWDLLTDGILYARQMVIVRDVLYCILKELSMKRRELGERPPSSVIPLESDISNQQSQSPVPGMATTPPVVTTQTNFAFWFSLSNPAPATRQLYLSLALETEPLEREEQLEASDSLTALTLETEDGQTTARTAETEDTASPRPSSRKDRLKSSSSKNRSPLPTSRAQSPRKPNRSANSPGKPSNTPPDNQSLASNSGIPSEASAGVNPFVIVTLDLNDRLQQLDLRIWEMMKCFTADDMVAKLIQCEEIGPALSSCQQIAEDEHIIWKNTTQSENEEIPGTIDGDQEPKQEAQGLEDFDFRDLAVMGQYGSSLSRQPSMLTRQPSAISRQSSTISRQSSLSRQSSSSEIEKKNRIFVSPNLLHGTYLPSQLQIHPFYPQRVPSGVVRLFFIDGVLAAVTHTSPWVFYPEVWKNRVAIIRSVCEYAESKPVKNLLRTLMSRANDIIPESNQASSQTSNINPNVAQLSRARGIPLPPSGPRSLSTTPGNSSTNQTETQTKLESNPKGPSVISIVMPDEKTLFGNNPSLLSSPPLTGSEYRSIDQKYRFLRKMKAWKDARAATITEPRIELAGEEKSSSRSSFFPAPSRLTQVPPSELLMGSTAFRLSCVEAPRATLSDQTKYHLSSLGGGVAYRSLLKRAVNEIDTRMENKILPPTGNEYTKTVEAPIPPPPPRNLVVIDVHVTIPPEEPVALVKTDRRASRAQPNSSKIQQKIPKLLVETHQTVGIFSTSVEKQPASLDTSLFTWQQLTTFAKKLANLRELMKSSQSHINDMINDMSDPSLSHSLPLNNSLPLPSIGSKPSTPNLPSTSSPPVAVDMGASHTIKFSAPLSDDNVTWTALTPESGVYGTKISLGAGFDLHVRFVGRIPDRDYLEVIIPKKIKKWLGLR